MSAVVVIIVGAKVKISKNQDDVKKKIKEQLVHLRCGGCC
jgi:hypothetical protein